ncbi:ATP synthase F0 subunit 8 (mitochondrion) [Fundulus heteroclitus]|uniref:ATP synthase complex subunit 8 n=1 Tax=Fundulus heteroclitus TaxID=8078 RepID=B7U7V7_FUNHE|nr:ATP synthase F0 subunit 8 [Fundulus heteroclitus]ACJ67957.1 ATPase subunit 8 [Fundulus heteroclitus]ACJ67970.1 ATPase subunit 8 [Fundulus heteroclitus]ACJ68009.1 ATPase subunit 8 [Fundulus heteroclitus]ACJ68022.1 ATPase subunit 8 [Fundulus heteroclitus]ALV90047.1 ATPase subunit 8 [Fundulus heteroclitus]
MPQLMPEPWFMTFLITWSILLTVVPMQIMALTFPYEPNLQTDQDSSTQTWNWQWL